MKTLKEFIQFLAENPPDAEELQVIQRIADRKPLSGIGESVLDEAYRWLGRLAEVLGDDAGGRLSVQVQTALDWLDYYDASEPAEGGERLAVKLKESLLSTQIEAAFQGHDLGSFELVEDQRGFQAICRRCSGSVWIGDTGVTYSDLEERCPGKSEEQSSPGFH